MNKMITTRRKLNLNVTDMAHLMGVHLMTYRKWESGDRHPGAAAVNAANTYVWLKKKYPQIFEEYVVKRMGE